MTFEVRDLRGNPQPGLPTARLIEAGGGTAYFVANDDTRPNALPGIWYIYEKGDFESPTGEYKQVRVDHLEDYRVDVAIRVVGPTEEEPYEDYFIVEAVDGREAAAKGQTKAHDDVLDRYGDEYGSEVTVIRTKVGGLFA